jgi:voltage-gated potassium channel
VDSARIRSLRIRLLLPLSVVVAVVIVGTLGYFWLWQGQGGTWMDALFMTVTTITTVGYGEVRPLDTVGRIFTMVLAIAGIGSLFYTLGVVMEYLVAARLADPGGRRRWSVASKLQAARRRAGPPRWAAGCSEPSRRRRRSWSMQSGIPAPCRGRGYLLLEGDATDDASPSAPELPRAGW